MDGKSLKAKIASGLMWKLAEKGLAQLVTFIVAIVLARILDPEAYGLIAMVTVFTTVANVFVTSGFSTSLIQKKDADELDFASIFWCTMAVGVVLYVVLFFSAPAIASLYGEPSLTAIVRVYAVVLIISAFNSIQSAYVSKHMIFRKFFFSTLSGTLGSGAIGVAMALSGFGVWALVAQGVSKIAINTAVLFTIIPWRPRLMFSIDAAKGLMNFGWKVLAADLIGTVFNNLRALVIGGRYTASDLAFYNQGQRFPDLLCDNIQGALSSVLFPAMSTVGDDAAAVRKIMRRSMSVLSYIIFPVLTALAMAADPLVRVLLTDKWLECVVYMQLISVGRMIDVVTNQNLQAMNAIGRSDVVLKLEFLKKPLCLVMIIVAVNISVLAVGASLPLYSLAAAAINMLPNKRLLGYGIASQLKDLAPAVLLSAAMGVTMFCVGLFPLNPIVLLAIECITGAAVYVSLSALFRVESFSYIKESLRDFVRK